MPGPTHFACHFIVSMRDRETPDDTNNNNSALRLANFCLPYHVIPTLKRVSTMVSKVVLLVGRYTSWSATIGLSFDEEFGARTRNNSHSIVQCLWVCGNLLLYSSTSVSTAYVVRSTILTTECNVQYVIVRLKCATVLRRCGRLQSRVVYERNWENGSTVIVGTPTQQSS